MKRIYKYPLSVKDNIFYLSPDSRILKCGEQNHALTVWIETDPDIRENVRFELKIICTGEVVPTGEYCDTVFLGNLVLHIYVEKAT